MCPYVHPLQNRAAYVKPHTFELSMGACNLILLIHVEVNRQLSKQGFSILPYGGFSCRPVEVTCFFEVSL